MKIKIKDIPYFSIALLGVLLRFRTLSVFEFKFDQFNAMRLGLEARLSHFAITHYSQPSSIGVHPPPGYIWFMGALSFFTKDPWAIAVLFFLLSCLSLFLGIWIFRRALPEEWAIPSSLFLGVCPIVVHYATHIHEAALMPIYMIIFYFFFYLFDKSRKRRFFLILFGITLMASMSYFVGLIFIPIFLWVFFTYRKILKPHTARLALLCFGLGLITATPYLYYLFFEQGFGRILSYVGSAGSRDQTPKLYYTSLFMSLTPNFFKFYFMGLLSKIYSEAFQTWAPLLLPLSSISIGLYLGGFFRAAFGLLLGRKFWTMDNKEQNPNAALLRLSLWVGLLSVALPFLKLRMLVYYHLVFIPAYAVLIGYAASGLWKWLWWRGLFAAYFIATIFLCNSIYYFLNNSGGYLWQYETHYGLMMKWKKELLSKVGPGFNVHPRIHYYGPALIPKAFAPETTYYALTFDQGNAALPKKLADLYYLWNNQHNRFEYQITVSQ